ncbi:hypothetical protein [Shewanella sp.]|uniref:hypothetical protein n=1 Tax=Shewanella sp. TaxID=50422 RepID=UPI003A969BBF
MKLFKLSSILALLWLLTACGGHDYEGTYQVELGGNNDNPLGALLKMAGDMVEKPTLVIGDDYIESDGKRSQFDDIFVRDSHGKKFLVFKNEGDEEAWQIIDDNTLLMKNGMVSYKLVRIE